MGLVLPGVLNHAVDFARKAVRENVDLSRRPGFDGDKQLTIALGRKGSAVVVDQQVDGSRRFFRQHSNGIITPLNQWLRIPTSIAALSYQALRLLQGKSTLKQLDKTISQNPSMIIDSTKYERLNKQQFYQKAMEFGLVDENTQIGHADNCRLIQGTMRNEHGRLIHFELYSFKLKYSKEKTADYPKVLNLGCSLGDGQVFGRRIVVLGPNCSESVEKKIKEGAANCKSPFVSMSCQTSSNELVNSIIARNELLESVRAVNSAKSTKSENYAKRSLANRMRKLEGVIVHRSTKLRSSKHDQKRFEDLRARQHGKLYRLNLTTWSPGETYRFDHLDSIKTGEIAVLKNGAEFKKWLVDMTLTGADAILRKKTSGKNRLLKRLKAIKNSEPLSESDLKKLVSNIAKQIAEATQIGDPELRTYKEADCEKLIGLFENKPEALIAILQAANFLENQSLEPYHFVLNPIS